MRSIQGGGPRLSKTVFHYPAHLNEKTVSYRNTSGCPSTRRENRRVYHFFRQLTSIVSDTIIVNSCRLDARLQKSDSLFTVLGRTLSSQYSHNGGQVYLTADSSPCASPCSPDRPPICGLAGISESSQSTEALNVQ